MIQDKQKRINKKYLRNTYEYLPKGRLLPQRCLPVLFDPPERYHNKIGLQLAKLIIKLNKILQIPLLFVR